MLSRSSASVGSVSSRSCLRSSPFGRGDRGTARDALEVGWSCRTPGEQHGMQLEDPELATAAGGGPGRATGSNKAPSSAPQMRAGPDPGARDRAESVQWAQAQPGEVEPWPPAGYDARS